MSSSRVGGDAADDDDGDMLDRTRLLDAPKRPRVAQQGGQYASQVIFFGLAIAWVNGVVKPFTDHYLLVIVIMLGGCALVTMLMYALAAAWSRWPHDWFRSMTVVVGGASTIALYSTLLLVQAFLFDSPFFAIGGASPATAWAFYAILVLLGIAICMWLSRRSLTAMLNGDAAVGSAPVAS